MNQFEGLLLMLDEALDTRKKRHIVGGILLSVSALFGGLAITVMTIKSEEGNETILSSKRIVLDETI